MDIFFQLFYFGFFKKILRLLTKHVKPICKLFFSKCLVVQGKGFTWEKGEGKFHVWTYFIINFTLCLIFLKVCSKDDPPFQIRQITRIIYYIMLYYIILYNMFFFIHSLIYLLSTLVTSRIYIRIYKKIYIYIYIRAYSGYWGPGCIFWGKFLKNRHFFCLQNRSHFHPFLMNLFFQNSRH